jgi:hypothetical protein
MENYDDKTINVYEQSDLDEFFSNSLDKIEIHLNKSNNSDLIKYFFQGTQSDIFNFQCKHNRRNESNFYSIQLDILNKFNIFESLESYTSIELMNGDNAIFCEKCNKKISCEKYIRFKMLPRILIIVLKRFDFDYNTLTKFKIHSKYEFPLELDMNKYVEGTKNNRYKLKEVAVHLGNSENGHYYSFIKDEHDNWTEFNDTIIKNFDINNYKEEWFGSSEQVNSSKTAYLLFYEKIDQSECKDFKNIEIIKKIESKVKIVDNNLDSIINNMENELYNYYMNKLLFSGKYQFNFIKILILLSNNESFVKDLEKYSTNNNIHNGNSRINEDKNKIPKKRSNIINFIKSNKIVLSKNQK